ncbi:putative transcriptional regulator [Rhodococcus opacus]|nr:putative transcriptional regulator [Rhodococcus opacus]
MEGAPRFRHPVLREDARTDLTCRTRVYVNRSTLVRLDRLIGRSGDALTAAAIRVAVRRLLDDPGDLAADLAAIGAARDLTPEVLGPRTNVHFDDDLRDQLDNLAERFDSDRAELMRLAARQLLANPRDLDQAVTEEIYRGDANRGKLLARNTRRQQTAAADPTTRGPAVRKAPSPQGNPFGKRHVFRFDEDTKRRLEELADEYGPRRMSALLRVGIRRLIENPAADEALAQARRVAAPPRTARVDVALDDELLAHLDALAARLGSNRQELVYLAATRVCSPNMPAVSGFVGEAAAAAPDLREWAVGRAPHHRRTHVSVSAPRCRRVHGGRCPVPDCGARTCRPSSVCVRHTVLRGRCDVDLCTWIGEYPPSGTGVRPVYQCYLSCQHGDALPILAEDGSVDIVDQFHNYLARHSSPISHVLCQYSRQNPTGGRGRSGAPTPGTFHPRRSHAGCTAQEQPGAGPIGCAPECPSRGRARSRWAADTVRWRARRWAPPAPTR